ncbi:hypothetical protein FQN57_001063 [Myotisia sp. PD_48]|nr:hypothetical protein FQN57_001063 [Myotisia sp. PD_48]
MGKPVRVGVVGAGIAGLRCADVLLQRGMQVTILEARDRIGGRVCQTDINGFSVDLGPNWIHGTKNNPIAEICKKTNTLVESWDSSPLVIDQFGGRLNATLHDKISDFLWTTIDRAFEYSRKNCANIPASKSLLDYFHEELEKTNFVELEKEACLEMSKMWGAYIGSPIEKQSLKFFLLEECLEGSNEFVASTYRSILQYIAKPAVEGAEIHLNEPVVSIEANPRIPGTDHQVHVKIATGKQYTFDAVVTTFPLGWLKRNKKIFTPALPERLSSAIDHISYGQLEKIYVTFPSAFWHTDSDGQKPSSPAFTHFFSPQYTNHPSTPYWNQECLSLASLQPPNAHPTLLFYTYGTCAEHIVSKISSLSSTSEEYYSILNTFLHPYYSRLPHFDASSLICRPTAFFATTWQTDPWAGNGSYSNYQVGLEDGIRDFEVLREGMGVERGVWFAGEHTAPIVGLGTTSGAYWSGEDAAKKVQDSNPTQPPHNIVIS